MYEVCLDLPVQSFAEYDHLRPSYKIQTAGKFMTSGNLPNQQDGKRGDAEVKNTFSDY